MAEQRRAVERRSYLALLTAKLSACPALSPPAKSRISHTTQLSRADYPRPTWRGTKSSTGVPPRDGLRCAGQVTGQYQHRDVGEERRGDPRPREGQPEPVLGLHRRPGDRRINTAPPNTMPVTSSTGASSPSPSIGGY
jgi:hypothetical protein